MSYCDYDADRECIFFFDDNSDNKKDIKWVAANEKSAPSRSKNVDQNTRHIPYINVFAKRRNKKEYKCHLVPQHSLNPPNPASPPKSTLYAVPEHSDSSGSDSSSKSKSGDITLPMNAIKVKELAEIKRTIQQKLDSLDKLEHTLNTQGLTISNPPNRGKLQKAQKLTVTQPAYGPIPSRSSASGLRSISEPTRVRLPHGYFPNACNVVIGQQSKATNYAGVNNLNRVQNVQHVHKVNMMQMGQQRVIPSNIQNVPYGYHQGHGVGLQAHPGAVQYNYNVHAFKPHGHNNGNVAFPANVAYK